MLITHTFFTDIYARKEESLQTNNWFHRVMFFENWTKLLFFSILGKNSQLSYVSTKFEK